jgi:HK97 family phage major capsid protein
MKVEELNQHIKDTVLDLVKTEVGPLVKEAIEASVKTSLAPSAEDPSKTVKQVEIEKTAKALQEKAKEKSALHEFTGKKRERQKGEALGACVRAAKRAKNDYEATIYHLKKDGHDDIAQLFEDTAKLYGDQVLKAMTAGDPETGGVLIPQAVSTEVIDLLRARVIVRNMNPITLPMPNGNFRLPKKMSGTNSYYVGESTSPTTSHVKTGSVLLSFKKQMTLVPVSNDLFRFSSPGADQLIRNDIVSETAVRQDQAFLRDPGTDSTPRGLRYWASPNNVIVATGGVGGDANLAAMTTTLSKLILKLLENNIPMANCHWVMSPRTYMNLTAVRTTNGPYAFRDEMMRGTLWGYAFTVSTTVPNTLTEGSNSDTSELYFVDAGELVIGDSERLMIDASDIAAYEEGGTVKAAYSRDETVVRAISEHDLVARREEAIAVATGVRWGV